MIKQLSADKIDESSLLQFGKFVDLCYRSGLFLLAAAFSPVTMVTGHGRQVD